MKSNYFVLFVIVFVIAVKTKSEAAMANECGVLNEKSVNNLKQRPLTVEYPWTALLGYRKKSNTSLHYKCQGVLISKRAVITIAACLEMEPAYALAAVVLGEFNKTQAAEQLPAIDELAQHYGIDKIILRPEVSQSPFSLPDIGIVHLNREVISNQFIRPICLPESSFATFSKNKQLYLGGYDFELRNQNSLVQLGSISQCKSLIDDVIQLENAQHICVLLPNQVDATEQLQYIAGAPLMDMQMNDDKSGINFQLLGIELFGDIYPNDEEPNGSRPVLFLNVLRNLEWIKNNIV